MRHEPAYPVGCEDCFLTCSRSIGVSLKLFHDSGRCPDDEGTRGNVATYYGVGADNSAAANAHTVQDDCAGPDPGAILDDDPLPANALVHDMHGRIGEV